MATTSIWSVKGWLGKLVIYVENPEKTENPVFYENQDMTKRQVQGLSDVIQYAVNQEKTNEQLDDETLPLMQQYVSGVNCAPTTARDEMLAVKRRFGKEDGVVAYHGYQSFAPGEVSPQLAHEIGLKLAQELWGSRFQVLVATHLDKESHIHNHFVLNCVSFADGLRYYRSEKDYYDMRTASDRLCREYGLSVIEHPQPGRSKQYGEWRAENENRTTYRGIVKADVDEAIAASVTERQFFYHLRAKGYAIKFGQDITVRPAGKPRGLKLFRNFGEDYTIEAIRRRILARQYPQRPQEEPQSPVRRIKLRGTLHTARKITGFRALYLYYCYKLGIFPKNRTQSPKQLHFLLREDLMKLENISREARMLCTHRIDTAEQLMAYKQSLKSQIAELAEGRARLYKKQGTKAVRSDSTQAAAVKGEISDLSAQLKALRREVHLCEDIAGRSQTMKEKLKAVRDDEAAQKKEMRKDEYVRRRS